MIISGKIPKKHRKAIEYFASQLFTPQKRRHLYLEIKYRKNMDYQGLVTIEDYNVLGVPNDFLIEICRNTEEEMLKSLAHEMVHVLQYSRGELNETMTMWRGRKVNADEIPYHQQPWEQQAIELEEKLYQSFLATQT
jgi:hypothetical protein